MFLQATAFITTIKSHSMFAACVNTMYSKPGKQNFRVGKGRTPTTAKGCATLDILQVRTWVKYIWQTCWMLMTPLAFTTFCKAISSQGTVRINRKSYSEWTLKTQWGSLKYFLHLTTLPIPTTVWHHNLVGGGGLFSPRCPPNKYGTNVDHSKEYEHSWFFQQLQKVNVHSSMFHLFLPLFS